MKYSMDMCGFKKVFFKKKKTMISSNNDWVY